MTVNGHTFNVIHNELVSRNYIIRYLIADACDYGIPQHRTRIYIVAFDNNETGSRFVFPQKTILKNCIFSCIDKTKKANDEYYLHKQSDQYKKMERAIDDEKQIYRFSDYGIQKSKEGISFTLKANMGTWYNRVPIIKDNFGIRTVTPAECLSLQGFPDTFIFPNNISSKSAYKQAGNSVVVPLICKISKEILHAFEF